MGDQNVTEKWQAAKAKLSEGDQDLLETWRDPLAAEVQRHLEVHTEAPELLAGEVSFPLTHSIGLTTIVDVR